MTFDAIYDSLPTNGWLTKDEARLLNDEVIASQAGDILEVGCYHGRSTVLLASHGRHVHCIDPFSGFDSDDQDGNLTEESFKRNLRDRGLINYTLYRCKIEDWHWKQVSFAYLDGDHTYEGTQRQIAVALQCHPSIIAIHDLADSGGGALVVKAAVEILGLPYKQVERLGLFYGHTQDR